MMNTKNFFFLLIITTGCAHSADLPQRLTDWFRQREPEYAAQMQAVIKTPVSQWPDCQNPGFTQPGNSRHWGRMTVIARCGKQRHFLQIELQVSGKYFVAAQLIRPGSQVSKAMLSERSGRLDTLPSGAVLAPEHILPAIALRRFSPGDVMISSQLRQPWRVKSGDEVQIVMQGEGFSAATSGIALNNAAAEGEVRVRTTNGQIVTAVVDAQGQLSVKMN